jgi:hypothetical protein
VRWGSAKIGTAEFAMRQSPHNGDRTLEIARIIGTEQNAAALQSHLKEIIDGAAFKGSHRSGQFLKYIVDQAIAGRFEALRERAIGIELFGRSPSYDTGEDAIVRVTASEVRKRLLQHYGASGPGSEFRISLPAGSYVPEIIRTPHYAEKAGTNGTIADASVVPPVVLEPPVSPLNLPDRAAKPDNVPTDVTSKLRNKWALFAAACLVLNIALWGIFVFVSRPTRAPSARILPWAAFFHTDRPTVLVTSDPNIAEIQGLTKTTVSASDYANQRYLPPVGSVSPEILHFSRDILRGDKAANVDTPIIASVAELGRENSAKISVRPARDLRLSDLDTESDFIFLGSPRSNPWTGLFSDQLDFRFQLDSTSQQEFIANARPRSGESAMYVATAKGYETGESFATISFLANPNHVGQLLLLGGVNAEGTKAAGQLVTNTQALSTALAQCGIRSSLPAQHFQLLLRVNVMAGSPRNFEVLACHVLR